MKRMRYLSPLRYPGGKARLAPFFSEVIDLQRPRPTVYAEPFAGGAGAALRLLVDEEVEEIVINDLNPGIAALWNMVFGDPEYLIDFILTVPISLEEWHHQREVYAEANCTDVRALGAATLYLNRCNRSGILDAGPIGGYNQSGRWLIDARFNRSSLADRVRYIGAFSSRVTVTSQDAREFIKESSRFGERVLLYVDPPYLQQGDDLYMDSLSFSDHEELAEVLQESQQHWLMTYDADDRIVADLYPGFRCAEFEISHTAHHQHVGSEFALFSEDVRIPESNLLTRGAQNWVVR